MTELVLTTFDWVPEAPRGFVRDVRVRWALEEAGLPYRNAATSFRDRGAGHIAHQPFGQVPWLTDGDLSIFESGAILLHLAYKSEALMPADGVGRAAVLEWLFAALNSVEMASLPWVMLKFSGESEDSKAWKAFDDFVGLRLQRMEAALAASEWLAGPFTIADIVMADVLRLLDRFGRLDASPNCKAYVARATARPAFKKAVADQMAHFAAADAAQAPKSEAP